MSRKPNLHLSLSLSLQVDQGVQGAASDLNLSDGDLKLSHRHALGPRISFECDLCEIIF